MSDLVGNPKDRFSCIATQKTNNPDTANLRPNQEVIKLFSCSDQLRLKFILLINVKLLAF